MRRATRAFVVGFIALDLVACAALIDLQEPNAASLDGGGREGSPTDGPASSVDGSVADSALGDADSGPRLASGQLDTTFGPDGGVLLPGAVAFAPFAAGQIAYVALDNANALNIHQVDGDGGLGPDLAMFSVDHLVVPGAIETTATGVVAIALEQVSPDNMLVMIRPFGDAEGMYDVPFYGGDTSAAALGVVNEPPYASLFRVSAQVGAIASNPTPVMVNSQVSSSGQPQLGLAKSDDLYAAASIVGGSASVRVDRFQVGSDGALTQVESGSVVFVMDTSPWAGALLLHTTAGFTVVLSNGNGIYLADVPAGTSTPQNVKPTFSGSGLELRSSQAVGDQVYVAGCLDNAPWIARFVKTTSYVLDFTFNAPPDRDGGGVLYLADHPSSCAESVKVDGQNRVYVLLNDDSDNQHTNARLLRFGQ